MLSKLPKKAVDFAPIHKFVGDVKKSLETPANAAGDSFDPALSDLHKCSQRASAGLPVARIAEWERKLAALKLQCELADATLAEAGISGDERTPIKWWRFAAALEKASPESAKAVWDLFANGATASGDLPHCPLLGAKANPKKRKRDVEDLQSNWDEVSQKQGYHPEDAHLNDEVWKTTLAELEKDWLVRVPPGDEHKFVYAARFGNDRRMADGTIKFRPIDDGRYAGGSSDVTQQLKYPSVHTALVAANLAAAPHKDVTRLWRAQGRKDAKIAKANIRAAERLRRPEHSVEVARAIDAIIIDIASAFRLVPLAPGALYHNGVAVLNPETGKVEAFYSRVCLFGNVGSVYAWDIISRSLETLFRQWFDIPLQCYVDDNFCFVDKQVSAYVQYLMLEVLTLLGFPFKDHATISRETLGEATEACAAIAGKEHQDSVKAALQHAWEAAPEDKGSRKVDLQKFQQALQEAGHSWQLIVGCLNSTRPNKEMKLYRGDQPEILGATLDLRQPNAITVTLSQDRKMLIANDIRAYLAQDKPKIGELKRIFGQLGFLLQVHGMQTPCLLPLIWVLGGHCSPGATCVRRAMATALDLVLTTKPPMLSVDKLEQTPAVLYTDASHSEEESCIGAILFDGCTVQYFTMQVDDPPCEAKIAYLEMYAVLVAVETWKMRLADRRLLLFVDNSNCLYALIRGRSRNRQMCVLAHTFINMKYSYKILAWADYVSSQENPADGFSRSELVQELKKEFAASEVSPVAPPLVAAWDADPREDTYVDFRFKNHAKARDLES